MNVLILDHFNRHGGSQEYILDIAKKLHELGVSCFIPKININTLREKSNNIPTTGFSILTKSFCNPLFYLKLIINIFQIKKFIKKNKITTIHCNSVPVLLIAKLAKTEQKIFFTCHDHSLSTIKLFIISKCCDIIISVSNTIRQYLANNGINKPNIVIFNGFFDFNFKNLNELKKTKKKTAVTFGLIGRIEKWKGVELFIEAAKKMLINNKNVNFLIIGYSEDQKYYNKLKLSVNGNKAFKFMPFCINKIEVYNQIDIVVNSSIECEPFGRTLVEAYISGLPVIGPNYGGPSEIIEHNKSGLVFKFKNVDSFYEKMKILAESPAKRKSFGIEGRKRFEETFHIDTIVNQIISVYQKNN